MVNSLSSPMNVRKPY